MGRISKWWLFLLVIIAGGVLVSGYFQAADGSVSLTSKPVRQLQSPPQPSPSALHVSLQYPLDAFNLSLQQSFISPLELTEKTPDCSVRQRNAGACLEGEYQLRITPSAWTAKTDGQAIIVQAPILVSGEGKLDKQRNIRAGVVRHFQTRLSAEIKIDLQQQQSLCPQLTFSRDIRWQSSSRMEVFRGQRVDIRKSVEDTLYQTLDMTGSKLVDSLFRCSDIQQGIESLGLSHPVQLSDALENKRINIVPVKAFVGGLAIREEMLHLQYLLDVYAYMDASQSAVTRTALEQISLLKPQQQDFRLSVTQPLAYETIKRQLAGMLAKQTYQTRNRFGDHQIRVIDVDVFPVAERLAIAIHIQSEHSDHWGATDAWVYVTAAIDLLEDAKFIKLVDVQFTQPAIDDWDFYRRAIDETVIRKLQERESLLSLPESNKLKKSVEQALAETIGGQDQSMFGELTALQWHAPKAQLNHKQIDIVQPLTANVHFIHRWQDFPEE